jgi:hypothetical protein
MASRSNIDDSLYQRKKRGMAKTVLNRTIIFTNTYG